MPLGIFDLDNTLVDRAGAFRRWAAEFVGEHDLDPGAIDSIIHEDQDGHVQRHAFMQTLRDRYGLKGPLDEMLATYHRRMVELLDPDPRVPAMLARLQQSGWTVAIATNGWCVQQHPKIERAGLAAHVDAVAVSEEVGAAKPDPRLFVAAARRCGARLSPDTVVIGDCPTRDIAPAHALGLRTVWLARGRVWDEATPRPDAVISDVVQAFAVLVTR